MFLEKSEVILPFSRVKQVQWWHITSLFENFGFYSIWFKRFFLSNLKLWASYTFDISSNGISFLYFDLQVYKKKYPSLASKKPAEAEIFCRIFSY